jgi:amino acid permease
MPSASTPTPHGFSYWVGVAFCVNYIMGCGFLAIPHRFFGAGVLLGPLVVVVFCVIMNVSKDYMLEAMGRAEAIANAEEIIARVEGERRGAGFRRTRSGSDASGSAASVGGGGGGGSASIAVPAPSDYLVSHTRRFEVADLFAVLMGARARVVYVVVLSGYMYGALWAYGTVFASSFAANVGLPGLHGGAVCSGKAETCIDLFLAWLAVFAVVAIPLACLELREQVWVQVVMFGARILVVFLMVSTIMHGWASCGRDAVVFAADTSTADAPAIFGGSPAPNVPLADAGGIAALLPVATYAFIFHHSVPVLATPIARKDSLPSLFRAAFLVCAVAYGALGLIVALGFGAATNGQCNLNWAGYVGCVASGGPAVAADSASVSAKMIRFVVLIFPAVDVLSAYPLNAITLGNNLMCAVLGDSAAAVLAEGGEGGARRAPTADAPWYLRSRWSRTAMRTLFRLLAAFPPIVAGAISASAGIDLDAILRCAPPPTAG